MIKKKTKPAHVKKRGGLIFSLCLILYAVLFLGLTAYGLTYFWGFIEAYELSRPHHAVDAYMEKLDADYVCDRSADLISQIDHNIQSEEECRQVIKNAVSGGISYAKKTTECTETKTVYVLRSGGKVIGRFEIEPQGDAVHGFTPWAVTSDSFDLSFLLTDTVSTQAPQGYPVYVNGVLLGDDYITQANIPYEYLTDYYGDYQPPSMAAYTAGPCLGTISLQVKDPQGNPITIDENTNLTAFFNNCSQDEIAAQDTFLDRYLRHYVDFTANKNGNIEGNFKRLIEYVVEDSMLATRMQKAKEGLKWSISRGDDIVDIKVHHRVNLGGGYYLCDVTYLVDTVGGKGTVRTTNNVKIIIFQEADGLKASAMTSY